MEEIERIIRKKIAQNFMDRARKFLAVTPEIKEEVAASFITQMDNKLHELVLEKKLTWDRAQIIKKNTDIEGLVPGFIEDYISSIDKDWLFERKDFEQNFDTVNEIKEQGIECSELEDACNRYMVHVQRNENVVSFLKKKASEEGIDSIDNSAIYAAFRQEYGSEEEYADSIREAEDTSGKMKDEFKKFQPQKNGEYGFTASFGEIYDVTFVKADMEAIFLGKEP